LPRSAGRTSSMARRRTCFRCLRSGHRRCLGLRVAHARSTACTGDGSESPARSSVAAA
jgi:hypothetical protein